MPALMIVKLTFHNLDWAKDYLANVPEMVAAHGGAYFARSKEVERIEGGGDVPDQVVVLSFPSLDAIRAFMAHPDYAPFRDARVDATVSDIVAIEY